MFKIIRFPLVLAVGLLIVVPFKAIGQPYQFNAGAGSHLVISPPLPPPPGSTQTPTPRRFVIHLLPMQGQLEPEQVIYICGAPDGQATVPQLGAHPVTRLLTDAPVGRVNSLHGKYGMWVQLAPQNCTDPNPNYVAPATLMRTDVNPGIGTFWTFDGGATNSIIIIGVEDGSAGNGVSAFKVQDCDCTPSYLEKQRPKLR